MNTTDLAEQLRDDAESLRSDTQKLSDLIGQLRQTSDDDDAGRSLACIDFLAYVRQNRTWVYELPLYNRLHETADLLTMPAFFEKQVLHSPALDNPCFMAAVMLMLKEMLRGDVISAAFASESFMRIINLFGDNLNDLSEAFIDELPSLASEEDYDDIPLEEPSSLTRYFLYFMYTLQKSLADASANYREIFEEHYRSIPHEILFANLPPEKQIRKLLRKLLLFIELSLYETPDAG